MLYAFTGMADGKEPTGGLAFDQKGNLYGTTVYGGSIGGGTVFQLQPPASGAWTFNVIHNLSGSNNGYPVYPVLDAYGNIYLEEPEGGSSSLGSVSQLSPPLTAGGAWFYKEIYSFQHPPDAYLPILLILDKDGNLYGVTAGGGTGYGENGGGTVFELVHPATHGGAWVETYSLTFSKALPTVELVSGVIGDPAAIFTALPPSRAEVYARVYGGYGTRVDEFAASRSWWEPGKWKPF